MKFTKEFYHVAGERFKEERLRLHYTEEQLAELLGVEARQIRRYQSGRNRIPTERAAILVDLGFDLQYIYTGEKKIWYLFRKGLEVMPTEMLDGVVERLAGHWDNPGEDEEFVSVVREVIMYGHDHMMDPKLRKIPALIDEKQSPVIEDDESNSFSP